MSNEVAELVSLLYSLIRQLAHQVPPFVEGDASSYREGFQLLDGSPASIPVGLELLQALASVSGSLCYCVIDQLQLLESPSTAKHLAGLIKILREQAARMGTRVLFTTNGYCCALAQQTSVEERINASRSSQNRPGF